MSRYILLILLAGATWSHAATIAEQILDESIPAPQHVQIKPFLGPDGNLTDDSFVLLEWEAVRGASYYRIFRSLYVDFRPARPEDNTDQPLVQLETPELAWIPWAMGDVVPGEDTVRVVVAVLDNALTTWAVSTAVVEGEVERSSSMTIGEWISFTAPSTPPVEPPLYGDHNRDGIVGFDDFFLFADHFGTRSADPEWTPEYDYTENGVVDFDDFFIFADSFGKTQ